MADNTIEIILKAVDNATAQIKQVSKTLTGDFAEGIKKANTSATELNSKLQLVKQAFGAVKGVVDSTVGAYSSYAMSMDKMARLTGGTAEQVSRLTQVADDVGISMESLGTAMQAAVRKGVDPSVNGIAKLSDEYLKLNPGLERSKFLMDNFGRSGAELGRLMEMGGAGIRSASAAIEDGLVVTEQGAKDAKEYAKAIDDLGDSWTGFTNSFSKEILPKLTEGLNGLAIGFNFGGKMIAGLADHRDALLKLGLSEADYRREMEQSAKVAGYQIDIFGNLTALKLVDGQFTQVIIDKGFLYKDLLEKTTSAVGMYGDVQSMTTDKVNALTQASSTQKQTFILNRYEMNKINEALGGVAITSGEVAKMQGLYAQYTQEAATAQINLAEGLKAVTKAQADQLLFDSLKGSMPFGEASRLGEEMGILTPKQTAMSFMPQLAAATQGLGDWMPTEQIQKFGDNFWKEVEKVLAGPTGGKGFDWGGLITNMFPTSGQDVEKSVGDYLVSVQGVATETGKVSEKAPVAAKGIQDMGKNSMEAKQPMVDIGTETGNSAVYMGNMSAEISSVNAELRRFIALKNSASFDLSIPGSNMPRPATSKTGFSEGPGGANGLDMTVPPGYPNDSFPIWAQSGERVLIQTPQQQRNGGGQTINLKSYGTIQFLISQDTASNTVANVRVQ